MSKQKNNRPSEHKQFEAIITDLDEEQGIVKAIFAVMGNIDEGNDRIWPGAFTKTFNERGSKVLVLDNHKATSTMDTIAKPVSFRELSRAELPDEVLTKFPSATGGAEITAKFEPDGNKDAISAQAFYRLKNRWITEWSFGYDPLDFDFTNERIGTKDVQVRNLRTLRLYEVSPVLWGMNPATMTTDAKSAEAKPWGIVPMGEQFCVFKLDENGEPTDKLKCYDSEDEASSYMRALYTNVEEGKADESKAITDEDKRVLTSEIRDLNMTDLVASHRRIHQQAAAGNMLTGFSRADMNWFNSTLEAELRRRAVAEDRDPPEATPLEWGASKEGDVDEGDEDKHFPGRIAIIRRRAGEKSLKAGRVLARRNADRIRKAYDALKDALEDAGLLEILEEVEETEKGSDGPPDNSQTPTSPEVGSEAGKSSVPDYLKLIEIERLKAEVR